EMKEWDEDNYKAMGTICLRLSPATASTVLDKLFAYSIWDTLKKDHGKPGIMAIFNKFRLATQVFIPQDTHPAPAIDKINMHVQHLESLGLKLPEPIVCLLLLSKLPSS
ncbi:hypothetical protein OF83DRAFT_1033105, partial [Amylostereum chailletii]